MSLFYANKGFYSRINFNFNIIDYVIIRKHFDAAKVENIIDHMQNILACIRDKLNKTQFAMIE